MKAFVIHREEDTNSEVLREVLLAGTLSIVYTVSMIEYITAHNIDDRVLSRAVRILQDGGLIALPTDASWTIACSLTAKDGIKKLRLLSGERDERHFTLLCSAIAQIGDYCSVDNSRFRILKRLSPGPYVFVLKALLGTEKALDIKRKEVGVRISDHPVPNALIEALGSPLYSITAKRSMTVEGNPLDSFDEELNGEDGHPAIPEEELFDGGWELESIAHIDLILDSGEERPRLLTTVLDLLGDEIVCLRSGAGEWPS